MDSLDSVLAHAKEHCSYYANAKPFQCRLEEFPVITRSTLKTQIDQFITITGERKLALLDALNTGAAVQSDSKASEFQFHDNIFIEQTSGSSGVPLRIPKTRAERSQLSLAAWRCRTRHDPSIDAKTFLPLFHRSLDTPLPVSPFDSTPPAIKNFYVWLNEKKIRWLHAPPSLIGYHARVLRSMRIRTPAPCLRFVEVSGSRPEEDTISIIEEVMGAKIINQYGTRETWAIGYAANLNPFDINAETMQVELLDDMCRPITQAAVEGAVVITSKVLRLLPIIRYKTGDRGCWVDSEQQGKKELVRRLRILPERDINMLFFNGKKVSGNILFKDVLHRIDHTIGYGYAKYMQVRKTGAYNWSLIVCQCDRPNEIFDKLKAFLQDNDPRSTLEMTIIPEMEGKLLAERKPHLFVNEWDLSNGI